MDVNYVARDTYGIYNGPKVGGPDAYLMGADTLLGNNVYNLANEKLGIIKEFMIEMATGQVAYAVLSFGGFMGLGDRLFAVPWQALALDTANQRFVLNISREALKDAPGFDKEHWPSMADPNWAQRVSRFYGTVAKGSGH